MEGADPVERIGNACGALPDYGRGDPLDAQRNLGGGPLRPVARAGFECQPSLAKSPLDSPVRFSFCERHDCRSNFDGTWGCSSQGRASSVTIPMMGSRISIIALAIAGGEERLGCAMWYRETSSVAGGRVTLGLSSCHRQAVILQNRLEMARPGAAQCYHWPNVAVARCSTPMRRSESSYAGGGEHLSSGGEISGFLDVSPEHVSRLARKIAATARCGKPVAPASRRYCFGVGFELALAAIPASLPLGGGHGAD
jgi:hypothetical protein